MKTCATCGKSKQPKSFRSDARTSDGLSKSCAACAFTTSYGEAEQLATVTLERVDILSEGGPYFGTGSPAEGDYYSKADLEQIVAANRELAAEVKPPNKIGHSKEQKLLANSGIQTDEQPAAGWLDGGSMTVEQGDDGKWKIFTDIRLVPAKIAKLFQAGAFRTRSVELSRIRSQGDDGETVYDSVVTGLAWLGAKAPAVRTLSDILAWYADEAPTDATRELVIGMLAEDEQEIPPEVRRTIEYIDAVSATIIWQPETGFQDVLNDLRAALNPSGNTQYWVQDVSTDLTACIVCDYEQNRTWVVPFTMDDQGDPTPAPATDWTEAEQAWVEAAAELADRNFAGREKNPPVPAYSDDVTKPTKLVGTSDEQIVALAKTFSLEGEGDALRDAVAAHLETLGIKPTVEPETPTVEPAAVTEPVASMSSEEIEKLKTSAALGERAFEDRRVEKREELLRANLNKIDPAELETWRAFVDAQPELAAKQLEALPELPKLKTYGADDTGLPADVKPEDAAKTAEDLYAAYAAQTGVQRTVTANG